MSKDAQNAASRARTSLGLAAADDTRLSELGAGTDPDFVSTLEHFEGMTHQAMYQAVHGPGGIDAAGMRTLQRVWQEYATDLLNLSMFNMMGLNRIFGSGEWQGASASAAETASMQFANAANQIGQVFSSVNLRLDALAWAAEAVRTAIQPPPASTIPLPDPDNRDQSAAPGLINPEYADSDRAARELARQEAVRVMNTIYKPNFPPAGAAVPSYVEVPQIGGGDGTSGGSSGSGPSGGLGGSTGGPATGGAGQPGAGTPPAETPANGGQGLPKTGLEGLGIPEGLGLPEGLLPGADGTTPASTTAAGLGPGATSSPNSTGFGASGPGGSGLGLDGSDRAGRSLPDSGGPGASRPGVPGVGPGVGPGAAAAGARPAGAGARGMPMSPMAPGGRRNEDDEKEHSAPDYLRGVSDEWTAGLESPVEVIGAGLAPEFDPSFTQMAANYEVEEPNTGSSRWVSQELNSPAPERAVAAQPGNSAADGDWDVDVVTDTEPAPVQQRDYDAGARPAATEIASTAPTSAPQSAEVFSVSGAGPMMDEPSPPQSASEPESFTISGTGPMMDDAPLEAASSTQFTVSGTGPVMDETPSDQEETSSEPEVFTVSGVGPMMDEPTEGAGRQ